MREANILYISIRNNSKKNIPLNRPTILCCVVLVVLVVLHDWLWSVALLSHSANRGKRQKCVIGSAVGPISYQFRAHDISNRFPSYFFSSFFCYHPRTCTRFRRNYDPTYDLCRRRTSCRCWPAADPVAGPCRGRGWLDSRVRGDAGGPPAGHCQDTHAE